MIALQFPLLVTCVEYNLDIIKIRLLNVLLSASEPSPLYARVPCKASTFLSPEDYFFVSYSARVLDLNNGNSIRHLTFNF